LWSNGVYRIVITARGHLRLATEEHAPTHHALAALVSSPVEATSSRALFDSFRAHLAARPGASSSAEVIRVLWQSLVDDGLIEVHGSSLTDAGLVFAGGVVPRPSWWAPFNDAASSHPDGPMTQAASPSDVPLIPQCITDWLRHTVVRLGRPLWGIVRYGHGRSPDLPA
jgi:hypothetical protein